jgi:hypothetical protein
VVGVPFTITASVQNPAYEAYGVHLSVPEIPSGVTLLGATTMREDGILMQFMNARGLTLGNIVEGNSRSVVWHLQIDTPGSKTIPFQAWSDNGGTQRQSVIVTPP